MQAMPIAHQAGQPEVRPISSLTGYPAAVLCWLLSAGVYIAAKWVAPEMPPWGLCFWRLTLACAILLPIVHRHHDAMIGLLRTRAAEVIAVGAIGLTLCQGMIYHGLNHTDATTAGGPDLLLRETDGPSTFHRHHDLTITICHLGFQ